MLLTDIKIGLLNQYGKICREPQIPSQFVWNIGKAISTLAHSFVTQMRLMLKKVIIWVRKSMIEGERLVHIIMWILLISVYLAAHW